MKLKTLSVLAGVAAPLIATASANAGFVGFKLSKKPNNLNLYVVNVYAEFDNPGFDYVSAVAGTPDTPLRITAVNGTFYGAAWNADGAPDFLAYNWYDSVKWDSFYTIGLKFIPRAGMDAVTYSSMPPLTGISAHSTNCVYGLTGFPNGDTSQNDPFDPVNSFPGNGQILIGQFSMEISSGFWGIQGSFLLQGMSDGDQAWQTTRPSATSIRPRARWACLVSRA